GIRRAVLDALAAGRSPQLASLIREHFTWRTAAWATKEAYELVVGHAWNDPVINDECPMTNDERMTKSE
ncbi:MAG: hypothetical protein ACREHD_21205, partial [Pirellulales bacterium]